MMTRLVPRPLHLFIDASSDMIGGNGYNESQSKELFMSWLQVNIVKKPADQLTLHVLVKLTCIAQRALSRYCRAKVYRHLSLRREINQDAVRLDSAGRATGKVNTCGVN